MEYKIKIHKQAQIFEYHAAKDTNLLQFLRQNNYEMNSPCNGQGTCGKCSIKLSGGAVTAPSSRESKLLGEKAVSEGYRLACRTVIGSDMEVHLEGTDFKAKVLTEGRQKKVRLSPSIGKKFVAFSPPSLDDQKSDSERLAETLSLGKEPESLALLRQLPEVLRENHFNATVVLNGKTPVGLEAGDTTSKLYGIAADIGTTTIAAYLLDLNTGERVSTYSGLNPQRKFGADVISRIKHTIDEPDGLDEMHETIIDGINLAVKDLTDSAGLSRSDVYQIVLVGNTIMMHFLLKLSAKNIAVSPFIPAATRTFTLKAAEIGIGINKNAVAVAVPSVAAYIGADTVSAVLASGMSKKRGVSLLVDFGTNGEIVLGNSEWLLACSAAAGPAFEGANIRCGVGGIRGAIDGFVVDNGSVYTTIGDEKPIGICGTGLVDIVSELHRIGIIDETGRLETDADELNGMGRRLTDRLSKMDGIAAFTVAEASETANGNSVFITQKDVRELQNAKAAIAAGIRVLVKRSGICFRDIEKVYLAGGFGTYIDIESALNIELIPRELSGRIESIGNAAGIGAIKVLASGHALKEAEKIKKKIRYIELSACKEFNDFFVDSMMFSE